MWQFVEYAARVRPQVAVFESVQLAYSQGGDLMRALRARLEELTGDKWDLYHVLHNALSVGGPAMRRRYFWVASRVPFGIERPELVEVPDLEDVIGDLRDLDQSWEAQRYRRKPSWYSIQFRNASRAVDGHISIDNPHTRRTRELLELIEWNPGEHAQVAARRYFDEHGDLPPSWSHLVEKLKGNDFFQGFSSPTMWNQRNHARVITGAGLLNGVHWSEKRTFTHREAARILGFPDDWLIEPLRTVPSLFLTWGKGITVHCGRWIAEWVKKALDGEPGTLTGDLIGERERLIDVTNAWQDVCATVKVTPRYGNAAAPVTTMTTATLNFVADEGKQSSMTEVVETPTEGAESTASRGRPRPQETIERDNVVLSVITEPLSRDAIAQRLAEAGTAVTPKAVYLSLWRLQRSGKITRSRESGTHLWSRVPTE
jgi:site-specific DNA-cytosine methylase